MALTSPDNIWTPDSSDNYALTTDLAGMADSIQDVFSSSARIVKVANVSARDAALADHGTPTTGNPLIVFRADAGTGREIEYTTDGVAWSTVAAEQDTGWVPGTSWLASGVGESSLTPIQLRVKNDWVVMRGAFTGISIPGSGSQDLATLPTEYRPTQTTYFPILSAGGTSSLGWITINTSGLLSATNGMPSANMTVVRADAVNYYRT